MSRFSRALNNTLAYPSIGTKKRLLRHIAAFVASVTIFLIYAVPIRNSAVTWDGLEINANATKEHSGAWLSDADMEHILQKHKHCFNTSMWFNDYVEEYQTHYFDVEDGRAKYVQSYDTSPYNMTCPFVKSRYNCVGTLNGEEVQKWRFILENEQATCDLRQFVADMKGPGGIARYISKKSSESKMKTDNRPLNVLIHGNSFLRQMFESMACQWHGHMTDNLLVLHGRQNFPGLMAERTHKIDNDEIGTLFQYRNVIPSLGSSGAIFNDPTIDNVPEDSIQNCIALNATGNMHFFNLSVVSPLDLSSNFKRCNNDIAMIEFDSSIRFYFIFRPFIYENISYVFETMGMNPSELDRVIYNDATPSDSLEWNFPSTLEQTKIYFGEFPPWSELQIRDIGRWLGADNVGMNHVPDRHGCMPGMPDDKANLMLFLLLHERTFSRTNLKVGNRPWMKFRTYCDNLDWC